MSLADVFAKYPDTDKGTFHSYLPEYEKLLEPLWQTATAALEVGVRRGGSLKAWREWFPNAEIWGLDNGSEAGLWEPDRAGIHVLRADSTDPASVARAIGGQTFDVVIDDGHHHPYVQVATWTALWPRVRPGGIYITEDVEDIGFATTMARLFVGEVHDLRHVKQRHDDIFVVWFNRATP